MALAANKFELTGTGSHAGLTWEYQTSGFEGHAQLTFHDGEVIRTESGSNIRTLETDFGTLVTITVGIAVDAFIDYFTVLLPSFNIEDEPVTFDAIAIRTKHRTTLFPATLPPGELDSYKEFKLHGTASRVEFMAVQHA